MPALCTDRGYTKRNVDLTLKRDEQEKHYYLE